MHARSGDRISVRGGHGGTARRDGEVIGVAHPDGSPPYRVRWSDDGRESLFFPGLDAHVEPAVPEHSVEDVAPVVVV